VFLQTGFDTGAVLISEPSFRDWGDIVSYVANSDGHHIGFAQVGKTDKNHFSKLSHII